MGEQVQTGGLRSFQYGKDVNLVLDDERKNAIEEGYRQAEDRKDKEKRNKMIFWIVIFLVLVVLLYLILRK